MVTVHRDNDIWTQGARGHTALVASFVGPLSKANLEDDKKYLLIEMQGPTNTKDLSTITGGTKHGCYSNLNISYVQRLKILKIAKTLVGNGLDYEAVNAVAPTDWDGKLNTITDLRCDALIEVCYELSGVMVWGMRRGPQDYLYDITSQVDTHSYNAVTGNWSASPTGIPDALETHNDYDWFWNAWQDTLMPATQAGYVFPLNANTYFAKRNLCSPIGSKGGN